MVREILFRGQTRKTGQRVYMDGTKAPGNWVYGGICFGKGDFSIIYAEMDEEKEIPIEKRVVYTDTVGQYTGLKDKNGKMIFEGDIVFVTDDDGWAGMVDTGLGEVDMVGGLWYISGTVQNSLYDCNDIYLIEVLGNVHDNPELIPVTQEDE